MSLLEIIAAILLGVGVLLGLVAAIGINRFDGVLMRLHPASKPQTLGLLSAFAGVALVSTSWSLAAILLLVLLVQMITVPVASTMVGRAAFRRGFVRGGDYAIDELSPRLAAAEDEDDDEDGFVDDDDTLADLSGSGEDRFPENVVASTEDAVVDRNWEDSEESAARVEDEDIIDIDLEEETEREAVEVAERDPRGTRTQGSSRADL